MAEQADADLLQAAEVRITPIRVTLPYHVGLGVVAAAMLLLPILYVALIGLLGAGVWYHATHHTPILMGHGAMLARGVLYFGPIIAGGFGILFMFKPIFARPPKPPPPLLVGADGEPLLHRYVAVLCRSLGAPPPREIHVDMQVNASASFRRGARSMLGSDLVLTLGLPLVAGLNVSQLSGILAHEFGHFTQAGAMRLSYLIANVNHWFARVVYERDEWDLKLAAANKEARNGYVHAVVALTQFFIWLSRKILWALMHVGHAMSAFLSRQMEYDADAYQVQVIGSEGFRPVYLRLGLLQAANQGALNHLNDMWSQGQLADDLAALTVVHARRLESDAGLPAQIAQSMLDQKTRPFDTHPSGVDRIRQAERVAVPAAITRTEPASALFRDFDELAARATRAFLEPQLGEGMARAAFVSVDVAAEQIERSEAGMQAVARVTLGGGLLRFGVAPRTTQVRAPDTVEAGIDAVQAARARAFELFPALGDVVRRYVAASEGVLRSEAGLVLNAAGVRFAATDLGLETNDPVELVATRRTHDEERSTAREALAPFFEAIRDRVEAAVNLASHNSVRSRVPFDDPDSARYSTHAAVLHRIVDCWQHLSKLHMCGQHLAMLVARAEEYGEYEGFQKEAGRLIGETYDTLGTVFGLLHGMAYPFEHANAPLSLAQYAVPERPPRDIRILDATGYAVGRLDAVYARCWGEIARLVEASEAAVGRPPLDLPASDPPKPAGDTDAD